LQNGVIEHFTVREQIVEVVNKLFVYTDYQEWDKLQHDVFTTELYFDMSSLGGEAKTVTAKEVCAMWRAGFEGLDAVNHLAGNYLVRMSGDTADVFAYATATHYKSTATLGKTREFIGSYNLHLIRTEGGWRIDIFKYNLKYANGNLSLT
jgi:hypothetical protein